MSDTTIVNTLRKASQAVYLVADEEAAKHISITFKRAASRIEELEAAIREHKESFEPGDCATEDRELWEVLGQGAEQ